MSLKPTIRSKLIARLERYEGRSPHLYLDSLGFVTVGVGHLIETEADIDTLDFYTLSNGKPDRLADSKRKRAEYAAVATLTPNRSLNYYKSNTSLVMVDADIDALTAKHIQSFYSELVADYRVSKGYTSNFDDFPEEVQLALFDMIFNLGRGRLKSQFVKFNTAVKSEDWTTAGRESRRFQLQAPRNNYVKSLFDKAAADAAKAKVP